MEMLLDLSDRSERFKLRKRLYIFCLLPRYLDQNELRHELQEELPEEFVNILADFMLPAAQDVPPGAPGDFQSV